MTAMEDDIHVLAKKLDRLENRVEHVVDKVVELGDRSPSPELDDLARLKRDLRKGVCLFVCLCECIINDEQVL